MNEQIEEFDVGIIGAGPVGGTLACRLAAMGKRVAIVDRAPLPPMQHPDFDGRAYAIANASRAVMAEAGLWPLLPFEPCPIRDIRVSDGKLGRPASRLHLHFDHRDVGAPFGFMVEARSLRMALNRLLDQSPNIAVFAPAQPTVRYEDDAAIIALENGPTIRARLIVAADGRDSALRQQAAIPVTRLSYDQTGIVCSVAHERPHDGVALEHFLPGGPFAQLPMTGDSDTPHRSAIVWTERTKIAETLLRLPESDFQAALAVRLGDHLGAVRLEGKRWHYRLTAMHAHRYYAHRLALIGDAAHGVHPIAGQGLNLGFRDIAALAGSLEHAQDPGDATVLRQYQRQRRPDNLMMLAATDILDRLFSNDRPLIRLTRDLGLAAVHRMPRLKQFFMRSAMGLAQGDTANSV